MPFMTTLPRLTCETRSFRTSLTPGASCNADGSARVIYAVVQSHRDHGASVNADLERERLAICAFPVARGKRIVHCKRGPDGSDLISKDAHHLVSNRRDGLKDDSKVITN